MPMNDTFRQIDPETRRVLLSLGWAVGKTWASKRDRGQLLKIWSTGRWTVEAQGKIMEGKEPGIAYAACEANEACWQNRLGVQL